MQDCDRVWTRTGLLVSKLARNDAQLAGCRLGLVAAQVQGAVWLPERDEGWTRPKSWVEGEVVSRAGGDVFGGGAAQWGPRPKAQRRLVSEGMADPDGSSLQQA